MMKFVSGMLAAAGIALATPALADPITLDASDIGSSFTIDFDGFSGSSSGTVDNLTSSITFTLDSISGSTYNFSYSAANTTDGGLTSNLSSFAFNVDPDISSATSTGAYPYSFVADGSASDPSYPNQIGAVDVCFKAANSGSCSNGGGVAEGNTGTGNLSLAFTTAPEEITLSDFFVRYQGITGAGNVSSATGQQTSSSTSTTTTSTTSGTTVPAPGMAGLLALALIALGFFRRRRPVGEFSGVRPAYA